jgi:hypothetical protein
MFPNKIGPTHGDVCVCVFFFAIAYKPCFRMWHVALGRFKQTDWAKLDGKYQLQVCVCMLVFYCESLHNVKKNTEARVIRY